MKTCGDCPWWDTCPYGGPGIRTMKTCQECSFRKAFRVVRDAFRCRSRAMKEIDTQYLCDSCHDEYEGKLAAAELQRGFMVAHYLPYKEIAQSVPIETDYYSSLAEKLSDENHDLKAELSRVKTCDTCGAEKQRTTCANCILLEER